MLFGLCFGLLWQCANPIALTGGEKDETPPKVVKDGILPANLQTNFVKQEITFTFDEWVKLNDAVNQIVVSPPLEKNPVVKLQNKELIFAFHEEEVLKEEATYTINFGEAIKDLTEGNPAEFTYVFSTGDVIDSLVVGGSVNDALTGKPVKDCLVMLYQNLSDTIVRTGKPYYFGKTNEGGRFKIENVKTGTFQVIALSEDEGQRYIFDSAGEGIGYLAEPVIVTDSTGQNIQLEVFEEEAPLKLVGDDIEDYGHAWFAFNREPYDLDISHEDKGQNLIYDYRKDSVHIWYDTEEQFLVYLASDTLWKDTVKVKAMPRAKFIEKATLGLQKAHEGVKKITKQNGVELRFNHPVVDLDDTLLGLYADTTQTLVTGQLSVDSTGFLVKVKHDWKLGAPYDLILLPGAVKDMYGVQNDTINLSYAIHAAEDLGELSAEVVALDSTQTYIISLMTTSKMEIERYTVTGQSSFSFVQKHLEQGEYRIEIILDANKNGRWDNGNYDLKRYPEQRYTQELEPLRANWTVEVVVKPTFGEIK